MAEFSLFGVESWTQAAGTNAYTPDEIEANKLTASMDSNSDDFGYGAVVITPKKDVWEQFQKTGDLPIVRGALMDPLDLSFSSEWESMENVSIPITNTILSDVYGELASKAVAMGGGSPGSVWKSKKLWKKSGDLSLDIKIKVVDWDGTGTTIMNAIRCLRLVVSSGKSDGTNFANNIGQAYGAQTALFSTLGGDVVKAGAGAAGSTVDAISETVIKNAKDNQLNKTDAASKFGAGGANLQQNLMEDIDDLTTFRNSPLPCEIRIGKYFHHKDMVITNVRFTFSKEVSQAGPLFVDISIQAVTRKIIAGMEDVGLKQIGGMKGDRVQYVTPTSKLEVAKKEEEMVEVQSQTEGGGTFKVNKKNVGGIVRRRGMSAHQQGKSGDGGYGSGN